VVISFKPEARERVAAIAAGHSVPLTTLGRVVSDRFILNGEIDTTIAALTEIHRNAIARIMDAETV